MSANLKNPQRILSTQAVAKLVHVSRPTLEKYVSRGLVIPDFRSNRATFFLPSSIAQIELTIDANRKTNWRHLP